MPEFGGCLECWLPSLARAADGSLYPYVADLNPVPPYWQNAARAKPGLFRVRLPAGV